MAKTKKEATPKAAKASTPVATAGASLANAFAQSAAFFGKKESYAAAEAPAVEETTEEQSVAADAKRAVTTAGDETSEAKANKKKKKKDKKRKLDQVASTDGEHVDGDETATAATTSGESEKDEATVAAEGGLIAASIGRGVDKSDRTIFVGNVSLDATQSALKTFFSSCGKVESVRLRFLPVAGTAVNDHGNQKLVMKVCANKKLFTDKRDFCHAYVTFAAKESAEKALEKNHALFLNKKLRIDRENPVVDPQRSVFVGNLSFHVTDEAVWAFFDKQLKTEEEPRPVENVRVIRDRDTGAGKGFGYVLLKGKALAAKALSLAGKKLQNRDLRVQVCGKRTKNKKGEDDKTLKHEGRRASGAVARVLTKQKARGELPPPTKKARFVDAKKPADKKAAGARAVVGKKGPATKGKRTGKPLDKKNRKAGGLAPSIKPKKPKHAARKARQAAEAAAAAKGKK